MEYITANGTEYQCKTITTGMNNISFTMEGQTISAIETAFRQVTDLTVSGTDKVTYGTYENLSFESATVHEDGTVEVTMRIKTPTEMRLEALEQGQASLESTQELQDEAIIELAEMTARTAEKGGEE